MIQVGWTRVNLTEPGRRFLVDKREFGIQQMHQDQVSIVPPGFQVLAETDVCACQAMLKPGRMLTIQAHPEYKAGFLRGLIEMRAEKGIFTAEQATRWLAIVDQETDRLWFADRMLAFILDHQANNTDL
jgi:GMP synthase-like glutamine amidotransferase